jgi:acyl-[acyl-carrier-protein]-phospholipid O-acyltransferase/long-chain-fatty-acid--[acyl-carrier-protein] ligase
MKLSLPPILKRIIDRCFSSSRTSKHALAFLNITQFLGVINDNVFKFVMAFLLIDTLGHAKASSILSATGAIYVIPFLLFSSSAGILADRFSKQKLLVGMKVAEIIVMILAVFAFGTKSVWGCYTLLFILSTHSAMFGPSKYGIIPELVPADTVSKANGLITSFTYLAIILGTFLASFLTEVTHRNFVLISFFCLAVAVGGFFSALAISSTPAQGSKKTMNLLFLREIYNTLVYTRGIRHLLPAIFGSSFFLMVGAFTQLNIIPFALQSLNLSEVAGGYLFLVTALGIALGSFLAGKASRKRIELGLSCLAGIGIAILFLLIAVVAHSLLKVILCLVGIGILGGFFIVPFDTFIQLNSDHERRGQVIAAANFLSFLGVLLASFALYFFNQVCGFSSAGSFAIMGVLTGVVSVIFFIRLSDLSIPYFSRKLYAPFCRFSRPNTELIEKEGNAVLILEEANWKKALLLAGLVPNIHFLFPEESRLWHGCYTFFYSLHKIGSEKDTEQLLTSAREILDQGIIPCIVLDGALPGKLPASTNPFLDFFKRSATRLYYTRFVEDPKTGKRTFAFEQ